MPNPNLLQTEFGLEEPTGPDGLSDKLREEILAHLVSLEAKVTNGNCKTFESYAEAVGRIRGLRYALGHRERKADEIAKSIPGDDE